MTRSLKWRIAVGLTLVFLAGVATGIFAGAWNAHREFSGRHRGMMGERMREHLKRDLDLTPEQVRKVDPILRETAERLQAIRAETGQRVTETMEETHRSLAQHLTPEQVEKLERIREQHLHMLHRRGRHHRPPEPSPMDAP